MLGNCDAGAKNRAAEAADFDDALKTPENAAKFMRPVPTLKRMSA
jgi:hypothetical protein